MPRYYFDIEDNDENLRDDLGIDLPGLGEVRDEAIAVLPEIARDRLPIGMRHVFRVSVRDESATIIFVAKLELDAHWTDAVGSDQAARASLGSR